MAKKVSNLDRLAAIRDKLQKTDLSSGGGGGFWSPPVGKSVIRIMPEVGNMSFFFQPVGKHNLTPDGKKSVYCPDFTSEGELPCPVCEFVDDLKSSGDSASKKLAGQLARRRSFWMNVIVRGAEEKGPQIFTPGVTVMGFISAIIADPDYGLITDVNEGFDITIEREGKGLDTEYQVRARRNPSPLSDDPDEVEKWLSKARDLSFAELSEDPEEDKELSSGHAVYVLPYERIKREYDLENLEDEEEDEDEEPSPKARAVVKKAAAPAKTSKRVVEEVEDEDDEEDDEEEDDEEPPAKQEVKRRMARRSARR